MKICQVPASLVFVAATISGACGEEAIDAIVNEPPVAEATAVATAAQGAVVLFSGTTSTDSDGSIAAFAWDFGDGGTGTGDAAQHIFNAAGTFTVTLTVTDDDGATDDATLQIVIDNNAPPTAVIVADATAATSQSVRCDGAGSSDVDGTVTAFSWDFGDGTTGIGPTFDKSFSGAGTFVVTLTVTDDKGATGRAEHTITITDAPGSVNGEWTWFLTDESLRDLGFFCGGSFQDSQLTILANGSDITLTEHASGTTVAYSGSLTGQDFAVSNVQVTVTQEIVGTFTSTTEFSGFHKIDAGLGACEDRPVSGLKQ